MQEQACSFYALGTLSGIFSFFIERSDIGNVAPPNFHSGSAELMVQTILSDLNGNDARLRLDLHGCSETRAEVRSTKTTRTNPQDS